MNKELDTDDDISLKNIKNVTKKITEIRFFTDKINENLDFIMKNPKTSKSHSLPSQNLITIQHEVPVFTYEE